MTKGKSKIKPKEISRQRQKPKEHVKDNSYAAFIGIAIIIILGIIIYSNSFNCSFHLDDNNNIVDNPLIRNLSDVKALWNYHQTRFVPFYTFAINYHFGQYNVWGYHLVNLIIHLVNALIVYWLTVLIFSSPAMKDNPIITHKNSIAFFTALLFVSHPLATQSVTYIVQRMTSMVAMFYLLSIALYLKARLTDKGNITRAFLFTGSFLSAILAMLTKENAFTLPFSILLIEFFFIRTKKFSINYKDYRVMLLISGFFGFIILTVLKFSFSILRPIPPTNGNTYVITSMNYLFTQFSVLVKYIQLLFLPIKQNVDYDFPISNSLFEISTFLCFLFLLALMLIAIFLFKRNRIISFGIFWFFITSSIESGFIPIHDLIFEHRTYLPSFGYFLIISSGIYMLFWKRYKYLAISIIVIIIGSYSILTFNRNKVWKDELALWNDVVSKSSNKARPNQNRGIIYGRMGLWDKAIADYTKVIEIDPQYAKAYYDRGIAYGELGQWDNAISDYSKAIEIEPKNIIYSNRGVAYTNVKQWDKAIDDYSKAIEIDPEYTIAYYNRGIAYGNLELWDKAVADYSKVIEIDPKYLMAYFNRGIIFANLRQWDKAIVDYSKAIEIDPKFAKAFSNRGLVYGRLGQWDKAITDYSIAIQFDTKYAMAYCNRGIAYENIGQLEKAIADYSKAIEADPNFSPSYSRREMAYKKLNSEKKR